jgi:hypothetical protein
MPMIMIALHTYGFVQETASVASDERLCKAIVDIEAHEATSLLRLCVRHADNEL